MTETVIKQARSTTNPLNIQEILDAAASSKAATLTGQQQYELGSTYASFFNGLLPAIPGSIIDPQVASGNLVKSGIPTWTGRFGFELDRRFADVYDGVQRVIGNCVSAWEILDDLYPELMFEAQVANPPFGIRWKTPIGNMDSSEYTWMKMMERCSDKGFGFFVSNYKTIERLKIHEHRRVYLYQRFPKGVWPKCDVEIGVCHFDVCPTRPPRQDLVYKTLDFAEHGKEIQQVINFYANHKLDRKVGAADKNELLSAWGEVIRVLEEEKGGTPPFNIYLGKEGSLKTYLSTRFQSKRKLTRDDILRVERIDGCHPMTLTTERESRKLLSELVSSGVYTIEPAAIEAINKTLAECNKLACPIMPVSDFEHVAYCDEEDHLLCIADFHCSDIEDGAKLFTAGKKYEIRTSTYPFVNKFEREKPHWSEEDNKMFTVKHQCELSGEDRYVAVVDDLGNNHRWMQHPQNDHYDHKEETLWSVFQKPVVKTISDVAPELIQKNKLTLATCELLADFTYYPGQIDYLAPMAVKDYGIVAAATGAGKSLMAISLIQVKAPKRALIIAPQGTMKSTEEDEDEGTEYQAAQWVEELSRFGPGLQVFQLFSMDDYRRICDLNGGTLPAGVFISYYQAMFSNKGRETAPSTWDDERLVKETRRIIQHDTATLPLDQFSKRQWCLSVGKESNGIRCIMQPCMATLIGDQFDMVALDEGHLCANLGANVTQMVIRLQPKYRYILSATPIPNIVSNLFSLMGWVCVPDWYKGENLNAAWPYRRGELSRFVETFHSEERDLTQEEMDDQEAKKQAGSDYWKYKKPGKRIKVSPIISSPARLLKILKPSMAYISKEMVNPHYTPPTVVDVRVPMGTQQQDLYVHYMNRGNIKGNALMRAKLQPTYLRNICADPMGFSHGGPKVKSNFNPKTIAMLELARDVLNKGDQVVIVCARKGQSDTLHYALRDAGVLVSRIDSTIAADRHSFNANQFKKQRTQAMIMGIKCAQAHSFDRCPYMIIGSIEFTPGSLIQAAGRIDRVNSKHPRTIWCVLIKHSYEETMFDMVATKQDAATICLQGKRVPRDYKPVDLGEVLANSLLGFKNESKPESECEVLWPQLRDSFDLDKFKLKN